MMDFVVVMLGVIAALVLWTVFGFALMCSKGFVNLMVKFYEKWFVKMYDKLGEEEL